LTEDAEYRPRLFIVIPALNEEAMIARTLSRIQETLEIDHEIIVVNDHSTDRTAEVVRAYAHEHPQVRLIDNGGKGGFTNALRVGYAAAGDGVIATMMADLCDDPESLPLMYAKILEGYDVVCGSRYMPGGGKEREDNELKGTLSRFVGLSLRRLVGVPTHDVTNAFKMYRSEILKSITIEEAGFASSLEITVKAFLKGARITEVPTVWQGRTAGKSKFSMLKGGKDYLRWYVWAVLLRKHKF
jgi:glycosyltransferase involved in cell wall biosynthesis